MTDEPVNTGRTYASSTLAFRRHADYGCAVTRFPKQTAWTRLWRLLGGRVYRFD